MFRLLLSFEWQFYRTGIFFPAAGAAFLLFGFVFGSMLFPMPFVNINAPFTLAYALTLLSLGGIFVATLFVAGAGLRDDEHLMTELIGATPVDPARLLTARFIGAFAATIAAFILVIPGLLAGSFAPWLDPAKLGPRHLVYYLWPLLTLGIPNLLFCTALLFMITRLSRNRMATYVGGLLFYILYMIGSFWSNAPWLAGASPATPEAQSLAALLDPFGLAAFFEQTRYWTPAERNSRLLTLEGNLLLNRLLWGSLSFAFFFLTYLFRDFRPSFSFSGRRKALPGLSSSSPPGYERVVAEPHSRQSGRQALISLVKLETLTTLRSLSFLVMVILWIFLLASETMATIDGGIRTAPGFPATALIASEIMQMLPLMGNLVLVIISSELVWQDRTLRMDEILGATPVSNAVLISSKIITLAIVVLTLVGVSSAVGMLIQIERGYFRLEPLIYGSLVYYVGLPMLLVGILVLFLQSMIRQRQLGILVAGVTVLLISSPLGNLVGLRHPLTRFGTGLPRIDYSDLNGLGQYSEAFHWLMIYWGGIAVFLILLAYGRWPRGRRIGPFSLSRPGWTLAMASVLMAMGSGVYIFLQMSQPGVPVSSRQRDDWSQAYEEKYLQYADLPQPVITAICAEVDLYPEERRYRVRAGYRVHNKTGQPVNRLLVGLSREAVLESVVVDGARLTLADEAYGHYWYELDQPLAPGGELEMEFEFSSAWSKFGRHTPFNAIVGNGSFMRISRYFPFFGYDAGLALKDPEERRKRGLPELAQGPTLEEQSRFLPDYDYIDLELIVGTSAGQVVLAPGDLVQEWTYGGRNFFHYRMDRPIPNRFAVASAEYAVRRSRHRGVDLEIYYHSGHARNIDHLMECLKTTLDYCSLEFGPYPYRQLRFAEVSNFTSGFAATAYPTVLFARETMGFLADLRDSGRVDIIAQIVAHEVAHQWWGGQLDSPEGEGAEVLTETLAQYTELMIYERLCGRRQVYGALNTELDLYLAGRGFEREMPLYRAQGQPHVAYSKGAKVMFALREWIGEAAVNRALRNLLEKHAYPALRPTTLDLLRELREVTPAAYHPRLVEGFENIVLYDLKVVSAGSKRRPDGQYDVLMTVATSKFKSDGLGNESPMPLDDLFSVGIFRTNDNLHDPDNILYLEEHCFDRDTMELSIVVEGNPGAAGIDPYVLMIDKDRGDNVLKVEGSE